MLRPPVSPDLRRARERWRATIGLRPSVDMGLWRFFARVCPLDVPHRISLGLVCQFLEALGDLEPDQPAQLVTGGCSLLSRVLGPLSV